MFNLGLKKSILLTGDGFTFLDRLSFNPYNEGEDLIQVPDIRSVDSLVSLSNFRSVG